jgi:ParB family chromosome partitioning protein
VEVSPRIFRRIGTTLLREPHDAMRHAMDDAALEELRQSMRQLGVLQPLCVVPIKDGVGALVSPASEQALAKHEADGGLYEVRAGHRRLLAARGILLESVPCIVFFDVDLADKAIMYHENSFREDPTEFDKAVLYAEAMETPNIKEAELEVMFSRSMPYIYERLKILKMPEAIQHALQQRQINLGIAKLIASVEDPNYQTYFLQMAVNQGATTHLVKNWINEFEGRKGAMTPAPPAPATAPIATTKPAPELECFLCGPKPSYELRGVYVCWECSGRVEQAQKDAELLPPAESGASA